MKTGLKIAVKKLSRPFQSIIHAKRTYRELRLLKHMKHENVSQLVSLPFVLSGGEQRKKTCLCLLIYWLTMCLLRINCSLLKVSCCSLLFVLLTCGFHIFAGDWPPRCLQPCYFSEGIHWCVSWMCLCFAVHWFKTVFQQTVAFSFSAADNPSCGWETPGDKPAD